MTNFAHIICCVVIFYLPPNTSLEQINKTNTGRLSVVFVQAHSNIFNGDNVTKALKFTTAHELGHNCGNPSRFTNKEHTSWHNGNSTSDNEETWNYCMMTQLNGTPSLNQSRLDALTWCEGHIQRGKNICWDLNQYEAIGQYQVDQMNRSILSGKIKAEISLDNTIYQEGKMMNLMVKIKNISSDTLRYSTTIFPELINLETGKTLPATQFSYTNVNETILPGSEKYLTYNIADMYSANKYESLLYPNTYMNPGKYKFSIHPITEDGESIEANEVVFEITPLSLAHQKDYDLLYKPEFNKSITEVRDHYLNNNNSFFNYEGTPSGAAGDTVFRTRYGRTYIASRPASYTIPMDEFSIKNRKTFTVAVKLFSALGKNYWIKTLWKDAKYKGDTYFHKMQTANKGRIIDNWDFRNIMVVPSNGGFDAEIDNWELNSKNLTVTFAPLSSESGVKDNKKVSMQGVVYLLEPNDNTINPFVFIPFTSEDVINVPEEPISFTNDFSGPETTQFLFYKKAIVFATLFTKNKHGVPQNISINYWLEA